jgi:hypothetical protein
MFGQPDPSAFAEPKPSVLDKTKRDDTNKEKLTLTTISTTRENL